MLCWHLFAIYWATPRINDLIFQMDLVQTGYQIIYFPNQLQLAKVESTLQSRGEASSRHIKNMSNAHTFIDDESTKTKRTIIKCV